MSRVAPRLTRPDGMRAVLMGSVAIAVGAAVVAPLLAPRDGLVLDDLVQDSSAWLASAVLWAHLRTASGLSRRMTALIATATALLAAGMTIHDVAPGSQALAGLPDVLFVAAMSTMVVGTTIGISAGAARANLVLAWLDAALIALAAAMVAIVAGVDSAAAAPGSAVLTVGVVTLGAWAGGGVLVLLGREMPPRAAGPYAVLAGIACIVVPALVWLSGRGADGYATAAAPADWLFSPGAMLVALGGRTWGSGETAASPMSPVLAGLRDALPVGAVVVAVLVVVPSPAALAPLRIAVVAMVIVTGLRQLALSSDRRASRVREADARKVALEVARSRADLDRLIGAAAFHPVYQPIVDLETGRTVGYEALTRFDNGTRPDVMFQRAREAGAEVELEIATLAASVAGGREMPSQLYLSLNVSPALAMQPEALGGVIWPARRDLVLEITEHVAVDDYELLMATLYALDIRVRIAVDDAGAGYAGLAHLLAIRPHIVKLDTVLVRGVDQDVARQALVEGVVGFARRTGATTVGEGIETEAEREMLRSLGVNLGQGYLLGRPGPLPRTPAAARTPTR